MQLAAQTFPDVVTDLRGKGLLNEHTAIITDFDNTVISFADYSRSLQRLRPEEIPPLTLQTVQMINSTGAKMAIATNRPDEGFSLTKVFSKLQGSYPRFPEAFEQAGVEVFGGGALFMIEKFKKTDEALEIVKNWILSAEKVGGAGLGSKNDLVVCIGDRPTDMTFFKKLEKALGKENSKIHFMIYKLPGMAVEDNPNKYNKWTDDVKRWFLKFLP